MKILLVILSCCIVSCNIQIKPHEWSDLEITSVNASLNSSDFNIFVQVVGLEEKKTVWDGEDNYPIPDYGVEGAKWTINYKDSLFGDFIHAKIIMNEVLHYTFILNRNRDSSVFVQVKISHQMGNSNGESSQRIQLRPKPVN